jgi:tryptophanyl-tRNA synthetase
VPKGVFPTVGARIMDLQEPTKKMSTTVGGEGTVLVLDEPAVIRKKFKTAVTDSEREIRYAPEEKPGISNLIEILAVATNRPIPEVEAD